MPLSSIKVRLNGREILVSRARLGLFLKLEAHLRDLNNAVKQRDSGGVVLAIYQYLLSAVEGIDPGKMKWLELMQAFFSIRNMNIISIDLSMLKIRMAEREGSTPWDHPDRPFLMWIHLLATYYGWSLTEIESLWPEDAAMYVQEILVDEQLRREWEHSLSPVAYPADKKGKTKFTPLPRPVWMRRDGPKKMRIPKKLLPIGVITDLSGIEDEDEIRH